MDGIPADLLPQNDETTLNLELFPGNVLHRDIRELAGVLYFTTDEIHYLCQSRSPFTFFLDQWCKREGSNATLERLHEALIKIQRIDLAELLHDTIENMKKANFKQLESLAKLQHERLKRREDDHTFSVEKNICNDSEEPSPPYVFVVHYPENENHMQKVVELVNKLRSQQIDAHADILETQLATNRQFYVFSNLQKADYVLVICSPSLKSASEQCFGAAKKFNQGQLSDDIKEIGFALNFIIGDIYRSKSRNSKFIPVFLSEYRKSDIPSVLRTGVRSYTVTEEFESLVRRIFQVPEYYLPSLPKKKYEPKVFMLK